MSGNDYSLQKKIERNIEHIIDSMLMSSEGQEDEIRDQRAVQIQLMNAFEYWVEKAVSVEAEKTDVFAVDMLTDAFLKNPGKLNRLVSSDPAFIKTALGNLLSTYYHNIRDKWAFEIDKEGAIERLTAFSLANLKELAVVSSGHRWRNSDLSEILLKFIFVRNEYNRDASDKSFEAFFDIADSLLTVEEQGLFGGRELRVNGLIWSLRELYMSSEILLNETRYGREKKRFQDQRDKVETVMADTLAFMQRMGANVSFENMPYRFVHEMEVEESEVTTLPRSKSVIEHEFRRKQETDDLKRISYEFLKAAVSGAVDHDFSKKNIRAITHATAYSEKRQSQAEVHAISTAKRPKQATAGNTFIISDHYRGSLVDVRKQLRDTPKSRRHAWYGSFKNETEKILRAFQGQEEKYIRVKPMVVPS